MDIFFNNGRQTSYQLLARENNDTACCACDRSNIEIALLLGRAMRTIEIHHSRIMRKLGVDNLIDLVKQTAVVKPVELGENK